MIEDRIKEMEGKVWMYKANNVTVESVKITPTKISIVVDSDVIQYKYTDAEKIFDDFLPTDQIATLRSGMADLPITKKVIDNMGTLTDTIIENIEKLKTDKNFIKQAEAINKGAQTLINMSVLEIKSKKLING